MSAANALIKAALDAQLPPNYQWGEDAMEAFNYGKTCAANAVEAALRASPRVEDGRREERERIAKIFEGQPYSEWFGQEAADMILALSLPDGEGKEKLATRASGPTAPTDRL